MKILKRILKGVAIVLLLGCFTSCVSTKKMVYLQGIDQLSEEDKVVAQNYEFTIQPDDQLAVSINSKNPELLQPFNNNIIVGSGGGNSTYAAQAATSTGMNTFQVDKNGMIHFPIFGNLYVQGLTRRKVEELIENKLREGNYVKDPTVAVKVMSFKVTVLGEVARPGVQKINGERLTVLEALGMAGDLLPSGRRENIVVIREVDGKRATYRVDLTRAYSVLESPCYYLQQNDIVYVEPNSAIKVKGSAAGTFLSTGGTVVSIVASIVSMIAIIAK